MVLRVFHSHFKVNTVLTMSFPVPVRKSHFVLHEMSIRMVLAGALCYAAYDNLNARTSCGTQLSFLYFLTVDLYIRVTFSF